MLPLFMAMTCLNGFFADLYGQSLGEAMLLAPHGGAVAVWASSGLTEPEPQLEMDREAFALLRLPGVTLGQAVALAKMAVRDEDVRRTWVAARGPDAGIAACRPGGCGIRRPRSSAR